MLSGRAFDELDSAYLCGDALEDHITSEFGAGRLFHVMLLLSSTLFKRSSIIIISFVNSLIRWLRVLARYWGALPACAVWRVCL